MVLGVAVENVTMGKIVDYIKRHHITFPNLHDPTMNVGRAYRINAVPMTYIINKRGRIAGLAVGLRPWMSEDSQKLVQQLLAEGSQK